jgi:hypothetical protein
MPAAGAPRLGAEQAVHGAARLERARDLQAFELERDPGLGRRRVLELGERRIGVWRTRSAMRCLAASMSAMVITRAVPRSGQRPRGSNCRGARGPAGGGRRGCRRPGSGASQARGWRPRCSGCGRRAGPSSPPCRSRGRLEDAVHGGEDEGVAARQLEDRAVALPRRACFSSSTPRWTSTFRTPRRQMSSASIETVPPPLISVPTVTRPARQAVAVAVRARPDC